MSSTGSVPTWTRVILALAGIYNLVWGALVVLAPQALFRWAAMDPPRYPQIWQCVGMIVGVYGVGYLIAARDPFRHWPIVLVGFLGKVFGPIGFLFAAARGEMPWAWGLTIITNDLIWWIPFAAILYLAFRLHANTEIGSEASDFQSATTGIESQRGLTLEKLSHERPVLVVFLRHAGCAFCRETLAELAERRRELESRGVTIALVHMGSLMQGTQFLVRFGLEDLHRYSDPHCRLYRAFGLERARFGHLFGPRIWWPALRAAVLRGHGFGWPAGDGFRSHGVFLLRSGRVIEGFRPATAAQRPDYLQLACGGNRACVDGRARWRKVRREFEAVH